MLVRLIMVSDWTRRRTRFLTLSFAQRVFPDLHPPDAPDALTALRAIAKVETLPFALERMGVRAPGVLAAAAQRALKFGLPVGGVVVVGADQQRADISAFQGSLALVERLVYARALQPAGATNLIQRLLDERTANPLGYSAHVAHWIGDDLLGSVGHARPAREPALNPAAATSGSAPSTESAGDNEREHHLLDAASGRTADPPTLLTWEGTRYRVDLAASEYTRMRAIRQRQGGPSLDDALDLIASARTLRSRGEGEDLSDVHATLERLVAHFGASESGEAEPAGVVDPLPELSAAVPPSPVRSTRQLRRACSTRAVSPISARQSWATSSAHWSTPARSGTPKDRRSWRATCLDSTSSASRSSTHRGAVSAPGSCRSMSRQEDSRGISRARCSRWTWP